MKYRIRHVTTIRYAAPVSLARFNIRLLPAVWTGTGGPVQQVEEEALVVDPRPWSQLEEQGPFLVRTSRLTMREPLRQIRIESSFTATVGECKRADQGPCLADVTRAALAGSDLSATGPATYLYPSPIAGIAAEIAAWARELVGDGGDVVAAGAALMRAIHDGFSYDSDATEIDTPPAEAFVSRHGVCQDFAHIMIIAARSLGIPAAYVSGYLRTIPPPGMPRLTGADAMHAWVALWCGEALGWIGFDPTNDLFAGTDHIFVAMGRDYSDVAPLDGVFRGGAGQSLSLAVDVVPLESVI